MAEWTSIHLPGTVSDSGATWANVNNVKVNDTSYATVTINKNSDSSNLFCSNFGFSSTDIPVGDDVQGVEISISRYADDATHLSDYQVTIICQGGQPGDNLASASKWPTSIADVTYGGQSELLGFELSRDDVFDSLFTVLLKCNNSDTVSARYGYVDWIGVRIYHGTTGGGVVVPIMLYHYMHH